LYLMKKNEGSLLAEMSESLCYYKFNLSMSDLSEA